MTQSATQRIYLIELVGLDTFGNATTFRWSTSSGFMTGPQENPPNTVYEGRVLSAGNFEWNCWQKGTTRGTSSRTFGVIKLANNDGGLDYLANYGVDGQAIRILGGYDGAPYATFVPVFTGRARRVDITWQEADIYLIDWQSDIADRSLQVTKFAGTNILPNGLEGISTDLQGKPKPILRGTAQNFTPPCVNTSLLAYQIDDGTALTPMTIQGVWDKGIPLTAGTAYGTLSGFLAASVASGHYISYAGPEGWYIRLGVQTAGTLTVTVSEGALTDRTPAQIVKRLLTQQGSVPLANINLTSISTCDNYKPYETGLWSGTSETTIGQVIDMILDSTNACLTNTRLGLFQISVLVDPAPLTPVATFSTWQIKDPGPSTFSVAGSNDPGTGLRISDPINGQIGSQRYSSNQDATVGLPCWRVLLNWGHNLTVQLTSMMSGTGDVAGAAALSLINFVATEYRQVTVQNTAVQVQHAKAPEFTVNTQIVNATDALTEANIQLVLRGVRRYIVTLPLDPTFASGVNLMDCIKLQLNRFGWSAGKNFLVIGMVEDYGDGQKAPAITSLICWG